MDFEKFYDEQKDYLAFRNDPQKRVDYEVKVNWKAGHLAGLIPYGIKLNNIIEIGCAMGILLHNIANRIKVKDISGLDISAENIRLARELYPGTVFYQGKIEDIKVEMDRRGLRKFDLVLLSDIIEHIPDDLKFLETVRSISSYVIVNLPLEKCFRNRNRKYGENDPSGHLRWYDFDDAEELMRKAGFEIIKSNTANALIDREIFRIYKKDRCERLKKKTIAKRSFWALFYYAQDSIRLVSKSLFEKIYGTNYFAFLKS